MHATNTLPGVSCASGRLVLLRCVWELEGRSMRKSCSCGLQWLQSFNGDLFHPGEGSCCISVLVNLLRDKSRSVFLCLPARSASCQELTGK